MPDAYIPIGKNGGAGDFLHLGPVSPLRGLGFLVMISSTQGSRPGLTSAAPPALCILLIRAARRDRALTLVYGCRRI